MTFTGRTLQKIYMPVGMKKTFMLVTYVKMTTLYFRIEMRRNAVCSAEMPHRLWLVNADKLHVNGG